MKTLPTLDKYLISIVYNSFVWIFKRDYTRSQTKEGLTEQSKNSVYESSILFSKIWSNSDLSGSFLDFRFSEKYTYPYQLFKIKQKHF